MRMITKVPPPLTWHICQIVIDCFFFVVTICILNQSEGHWLLSGAFHFAISMSLRLRKETKNAPSFQTLMEKDLGATFELIFLASNSRKEVCEVLNNFLSFLKKIDEKKNKKC